MLKIKALLVVFLLMNVMFMSAQKKDNLGLLWVIEDTNTSQKSHVYGTMHVSQKIAFHLGEEFFKAIDSADAIALESNPLFWIDDIMNNNFSDRYLGQYAVSREVKQGFYKQRFPIKPLSKQNLAYSISSNHYLTNWLLYRENNADYEEDTYLDMFIYQAGKKQDKPVISLEKYEQTTIFSEKANIPDEKEKKPSAWYKEITKDKNYTDVIKDAYRNKDLFLIDSIYKETSSDTSLKYMLYERNKVMAHNIDSISKSGTSLFVGIGAAHLPGEEGVLELLRKKGYSVYPSNTTITPQCKKRLEEMEQLKKEIIYNKVYKTDLFEVLVPHEMYETPSVEGLREFLAAELTNGTFYTIRLESTYSYLTDKKQGSYVQMVKEMLYENIPGKIIEKKEINEGGYPGVDVLNRTKSGDFQRYKILITPLHVMIFKIGGRHDYVKDHGNELLDSITIYSPQKSWQTISPMNQEFEVTVPGYFTIENDDRINKLYGYPHIQAFDCTDSSYYFTKMRSINDVSFMEEDTFEMNRIIQLFAEEIDAEIESIKLEAYRGYPSAFAKCQLKNNNYIFLKVIIKGPHYHLIGQSTKDSVSNNFFFDSFVFGDLLYQKTFQEVIDTTYLFKVKSNFVAPDFYKRLYGYKSLYSDYLDEDEEDSFKSFTIRDQYISENYEIINVKLTKFHDYAYVRDVNEIWKEELDEIKKINTYSIHSEKEIEGATYPSYEVQFRDTNTSQMVKVRFVLCPDRLYTLSVSLDTLSGPTRFVETFFNTFEPFDTLVGKSIFKNKTDSIFDWLQFGNQVQKQKAKKILLDKFDHKLTFENVHANTIIRLIGSQTNPSEDLALRIFLIEELGKLKHRNILPFLEDLYYQVDGSGIYQKAILKALAYQRSKESGRLILELLDHDFPIKNVAEFFDPYKDSLEMITLIFPEILDHINKPGYNYQIFNLLSKSLEKDIISPKEYKKYMKDILTYAQLELKYQLESEQEKISNKDKNLSYAVSLNQGSVYMNRFIDILLPFIDNKNVNAYLNKIRKVKDFDLLTYYYIQLIDDGMSVPDSIFMFLAEDEINRCNLYDQLNRINRLDLFPDTFKNQLDISKSQLLARFEKLADDTVTFLQKDCIHIKGEETGYVYFFKRKLEKEDKWNLCYVGIHPEETSNINISPNYVNYHYKSYTTEEEIENAIETTLKHLKLEGRKRAEQTSYY